jgi:three-Cys-motif partner protein
MRDKWHCRVYIDLFAGAGRAKLKGTSTIVPGSPLLAIRIPNPFDKYIFCEQDQEKLSVLKKRTSDLLSSDQVSFISGDVNANVEKILTEIPKAHSDYKVLGFCFADPYSVRNLRFETIRRLSARYIDFLVLIPNYMDANRNLSLYLAEHNTALDDFLGSADWRREWEEAQEQREKFPWFLVDTFGRQMAKEGYIYHGRQETVPIRFDEKNVPLYVLMFFSRNPLGTKFWKQAMKYSTDQRELF